MRAKPENEKSFISEILELRMYSNTLREDFHAKIINWVDKIPLGQGRSGEALTFILPTRGCKYATAKHGGCSMCTLPTDNPLNPTEELINSFAEKCLDLFNKKGGEERFSGVKFYNSGSFLDRWEIPTKIQQEIIKTFAEKVEQITIETRCECVTRKNLEPLLEVIEPRKLIVAIGQETTNDEINKRSINKGHTHKQFSRAIKVLKEYGITTKGYILLKPIFVSELTAINDVVATARDMNNLGVNMISINPSYIGKATLMEKLFNNRGYQSPWLWSVYYSAIRVKQIVGEECMVVADPVAAGSNRGPRNCGSCDADLKELLKEFSATQDLDKLIGIEKCGCETVYKSAVTTEHLSGGYGVGFGFKYTSRRT